jgi:hypothetical protein
MSREIGIWIAILLPIVIGASLALILALSSEREKRPMPKSPSEEKHPGEMIGSEAQTTLRR